MNVSTKHRDLDIWMDKVDQHVQAIAGLSLYDLPDVPLADWFDDGFRPREAAQLALEDAGF
jgi:hypothetical protein